MEAFATTLVIGAGNELLGDEGLGVHVARLLAAHPSLPDEVTVVEAGTSLLDLVPEFPRYSRVILVDAIRAGHPPGTVVCAESVGDLDDETEADSFLSLHGWGVVESLHAAKKLHMEPRRLTIFGAEPEITEPGMELSPVLAKAAGRIVAAILRDVAAPESCPIRQIESR